MCKGKREYRREGGETERRNGKRQRNRSAVSVPDTVSFMRGRNAQKERKRAEKKKERSQNQNIWEKIVENR